MIIEPFFLPFSVVFSNKGLINSSSTVDVGLVKLSSDCICGNRVFKMKSSSADTFAMIFRQNPLQYTAIHFNLFWFSATIPLS